MLWQCARCDSMDAVPGLWEVLIPAAVIICVIFIVLHLPGVLTYGQCSVHFFFND